MDNQILLVTDNGYNMDEIVSALESDGFPVESISDPEIGKQIFERKPPPLLLLRFETLQSAKKYCQNLSRDSRLNKIMLLCTLSDAEEATKLAVGHLIDEYFIIEPLYNLHRLNFCVHHALEQVLAEIHNRMKIDALRKELSKGQIQLAETSARMHDELIQQVGDKLDQFKQKMSTPDFSDAVQVVDPSALDQRFGQLKNEELGPTFGRFKNNLVRSISGLFDGLKQRFSPQTQRPQRRRQVGQGNILVIDPDPNAQEFLTMILEQGGYSVLQAKSGKEGVMQALKDRPDLILIDITIADVNAFELIGRIKMSSKLKGIPIMIITAYASKQSVQQGIEVGVSDFIVKPMQPAVVLQKIKGKFPARSARKSR